MQLTLTSFALLSGLIVAIGAVYTSLALKNAPEGHEDADGFHYGLENAQPVAIEATPSRRAVRDLSESAWANTSEQDARHAVMV